MQTSIALASDVKASARLTVSGLGSFISLWFVGDDEGATIALPLRGSAGAAYARQLADQLVVVADQLEDALTAAAVSEGGL